MPRQVHPVIAARFGSDSAKPRAVRVYSAENGWASLPKPKVLTPDVIADLRREGHTMVEARWRLQTKQVSLSGLI